MQLNDLRIGEICVYDGYESFVEAELVEVLAKYEGRTPDRDVLIKSLTTGEEFRSYSTALVSLEKADHELWLTIKQAENLRQEVKSKLNKKYNSNL